MEVATKLFARNGYEATTTAAIALAAGVTEPILYRHFKSKQELFVAIVKAVSDRTMKHWEDLIRGIDDPAEQFRRIAADLPQHMEKLADAYHVLHGALATSRDKKVLGGDEGALRPDRAVLHQGDPGRPEERRLPKEHAAASGGVDADHQRHRLRHDRAEPDAVRPRDGGQRDRRHPARVAGLNQFSLATDGAPIHTEGEGKNS